MPPTSLSLFTKQEMSVCGRLLTIFRITSIHMTFCKIQMIYLHYQLCLQRHSLKIVHKLIRSGAQGHLISLLSSEAFQCLQERVMEGWGGGGANYLLFWCLLWRLFLPLTERRYWKSVLPPKSLMSTSDVIHSSSSSSRCDSKRQTVEDVAKMLKSLLPSSGLTKHAETYILNLGHSC